MRRRLPALSAIGLAPIPSCKVPFLACTLFGNSFWEVLPASQNLRGSTRSLPNGGSDQLRYHAYRAGLRAKQVELFLSSTNGLQSVGATYVVGG